MKSYRCSCYRSARGAALVEYAFMLGLLGLVLTSSIRWYAGGVSENITTSANKIKTGEGAGSPAPGGGGGGSGMGHLHEAEALVVHGLVLE